MSNNISIRHAVKKYGENISAAREALGISVNTLKKYLAEPVKL